MLVQKKQSTVNISVTLHKINNDFLVTDTEFPFFWIPPSRNIQFQINSKQWTSVSHITGFYKLTRLGPSRFSCFKCCHFCRVFILCSELFSGAKYQSQYSLYKRSTFFKIPEFVLNLTSYLKAINMNWLWNLLIYITQYTTSSLKVEAVCSSETLVSTYKSTWHYNPEDQQWHPVTLVTELAVICTCLRYCQGTVTNTEQNEIHVHCSVKSKKVKLSHQ
jgi:hypothetical protein